MFGRKSDIYVNATYVVKNFILHGWFEM